VDAQKPGAENKDDTKMEEVAGAPTDATNGDTKSEDKKDQVSPLTFIQCCGSGMFIPDPDFIRAGSHNSNNLVAIFSSAVECAYIRFSTNPLRVFFAYHQKSIAHYGYQYILYRERPSLKL
jgi:hypothetical protein